jgi:hypothetical protein
MHVAITGSSGLIGRALIAELEAHDHRVLRIVRRPPGVASEVRWDPEAGMLDADALRGVDAVVHLAGEGIGARRWSERQKRRIRESRTLGTRLVAETLALLAGSGGGPRVLVSASGVHYYGDRGDAVLTEESSPGDGFLAGVVQAWESSADPARDAGLRVVHPRMGIVQAEGGEALDRMLPLFRLGLGGRLGSGRQYWSWVSIADVVGIISHALVTDDLDGPVNVTAPEPVTNAEFTATLARVLRRPAVLAVPRFGPGLVLGRELAEELAFASIRALPDRALASGYRFRHTALEGCLRELLGRPA